MQQQIFSSDHTGYRRQPECQVRKCTKPIKKAWNKYLKDLIEAEKKK